MNTLCPGEAGQGREGDVPQRRLRPESLAGVGPVVGRLGFRDKSDHPSLTFVKHVTVVVNVELVVTNDALLVRSFLLNLKVNVLDTLLLINNLLTNLIYLKSSVLCSLVFLDKSSET